MPQQYSLIGLGRPQLFGLREKERNITEEAIYILGHGDSSCSGDCSCLAERIQDTDPPPSKKQNNNSHFLSLAGSVTKQQEQQYITNNNSDNTCNNNAENIGVYLVGLLKYVSCTIRAAANLVIHRQAQSQAQSQAQPQYNNR
jgi:hypothetical protein